MNDRQKTLYIMTPRPETRYSLVIPAYNEEQRIVPLFDAIHGFEGELIVVCDGVDGTADTVDRIASRRPDLNIRCLRFESPARKRGRSDCRPCSSQVPVRRVRRC